MPFPGFNDKMRRRMPGLHGLLKIVERKWQKLAEY
jgi:hypothetical protein